MKKELLLWGYPVKDTSKFEAKGIDIGSVGISEAFNPKKTHPDFDYPWVSIYPNKPLLPMPDEVVVCFKRIKSIEFDFLPYGGFFLFSARLLSFLIEHGFCAEFGQSRAHLLNTKGIPLTDEIFYLVRHVKWEVESVIEWIRDEDGKIVEASTESSKEVFFLSLKESVEAKELGPNGCFLVSAALREEIEHRFKNPALYTVSEWREVNNGGWSI